MSGWKLPKYDTFFKPLSAYDFCADMDAKITGAIGMTGADASILASVVSMDGDHLEIGALWGGSAILSAETKKRGGWKGNIICVDDGAMANSKNVVLDNARIMGVDDRIVLHLGNSTDYDHGDTKYATALIDAGHGYSDCMNDFRKIDDHVTGRIMIHDYDPDHQGVVDAVNTILRVSSSWFLLYCAEHSVVLERN